MAAAPRFVAVRVTRAAQTAAYPFELSLCDGRVLRFDARADAAALGAVLRALEGGGSC